MTKPLAIDLFCGLGGWASELLAEQYDVVGFDIERHVYGEHRYPAQLVIQDVLTLHGSQFRQGALIVASPPCQKFSYMAMPWSLAKAKAAAIRADATGQMRRDLTRLFDACFRIQREASEAAGRRIPMVVENVRGAQPWVGRAAWNFGSFYLWGDVPALMPIAKARKNTGGSWFNVAHNTHSGLGNNARDALCDGYKSSGMNSSDQTKRGQDFTRIAGEQAGVKGIGGGKDGWFGDYSRIKQGGDWFNSTQPYIARRSSSKSPARKMASAMIAKIPPPLARWIAATYHPRNDVAATVSSPRSS